MSLRKSVVSAVLGLLGVVALHPAVARADDDSPTTESASGASSSTEDAPVVPDPANEVHYGVGFRFRNVRIPKFAFGLFLDNAPGGTSDLGYGIDITRRKGESELQLGFEFDRITPKEGVYINSGDNVALGDEADYLLDPKHSDKKLGWATIEFTYLKHVPITKGIAFRYGGGLGLGILTGGVDHYDVPCNGATNDDPEPGCKPVVLGGTATAARGPVEYGLPPVFPVLNAIIGIQFRPLDALTVNLETGIRTLPFVGVSASYFF